MKWNGVPFICFLIVSILVCITILSIKRNNLSRVVCFVLGLVIVIVVVCRRKYSLLYLFITFNSPHSPSLCSAFLFDNTVTRGVVTKRQIFSVCFTSFSIKVIPAHVESLQTKCWKYGVDENTLNLLVGREKKAIFCLLKSRENFHLNDWHLRCAFLGLVQF